MRVYTQPLVMLYYQKFLFPMWSMLMKPHFHLLCPIMNVYFQNI